MTFKRTLSFACVLLLGLSLVSSFVFATVPEAEETADIEDVEAVVAETGEGNCLPDDCYERTEVIEREFLCAESELQSEETYRLMDAFTESEVENFHGIGYATEQKHTCVKDDEGMKLKASEDQYLSFDDDGVLIGVTNWTVDGQLCDNNQKNTKIKVLSSVKVSEYEENIRVLLKLDEDYVLETSRDWDDDYYEYRWLKRDANGVLSEYDSAKAYVSKIDGTVVSLGFFYTKERVESKNRLITEKEAIAIADEFLTTSYDVEAKSTSVTFAYRSADRTGVLEENDKDIHYCYAINYDDAFIVYIDASSGNPIAVDAYLSERTAAFGTTLNNISDLHGYDATTAAYAGMRALGYVGYSRYSNDTATLKTNITNYIGLGGNEYAMYIRCHGDGESIYGKSSSGSIVWTMEPSDFSGNWHFVFIDACKSGMTNSFASALHISSSYSNRAFLGWYEDALSHASRAWGEEFWDIIGSYTSRTVRQAALDAAALITSSTPIRFYGDTSYNGRAWS